MFEGCAQDRLRLFDESLVTNEVDEPWRRGAQMLQHARLVDVRATNMVEREGR